MIATRRLTPADADTFRALRIEAFTVESDAFRSVPGSMAALPRAEIEARLARDHVVGVFAECELVGLGGLQRLTGEKLAHKAFVWGMYLRASFRGSGAADLIMRDLIAQARTQMETVLLTVVASNSRAIGFYERWGFRTYGVEPVAVKRNDGTYLDEALMVLRLD